MTLPDEEARAMVYAQVFMRELLDSKKTPKVPAYVRRAAYRVLRHYPAWFRVAELTGTKAVKPSDDSRITDPQEKRSK